MSTFNISNSAWDASLKDISMNAEYWEKFMSNVGWKARMNSLNEDVERKRLAENEFFSDETPMRNPNKLLSVALTTIMLCAQDDTDLPSEYFMWTELYLRAIKDEFDEYPPNISKFLSFLTEIKEKHGHTWKYAEDDNPEPEMKFKIPKSVQLGTVKSHESIDLDVNDDILISKLADISCNDM